LKHTALLNLAADKDDESGPPQFNLPTAEKLQPLFPDLEIGDVLGSGGMGCVFRAHQTKLDRTIALKVLPEELSQDALFTERFAREARAMARLNHTGIVGIYDFGSVQETHYLILEYLNGSSLRELEDAGPIETDEALSIVEQVCAALEYAHAEGVVHRDIKPENILFDQSGRVVLADFGLARLAMDSRAPVSLTQTRQAMGTLNYMAPEQWENPKTVDHRADVYALGILLYEMLTGRIPRGSFPPASTLAGVPESFDEVINRTLQIDADDRYQSVAEFADALRAAASGQSAEPLEFAQHGTVTNFRNIGAAILNRVPLPAAATAAAEPEKKSAWSATGCSSARAAWGFFTVCVFLLALPWAGASNDYIPGVLLMTREFMSLFDAPNSLMFFELLIVCLACSTERQIHPVRARAASIVLLGFCITQIVFFNFENDHDSLTAAPFVFFLVVCLFAAELIIRTLFQLEELMRWQSLRFLRRFNPPMSRRRRHRSKDADQH